MSPGLLLDPEPQSVRRARRWVGEALEDLGREDLVDSAQLGVSELVTNAILHAGPPVTVRVRGTAQHPRVEVHDASRRPPSLNTAMADDDQLLSTVGRGLAIIALYSATWGAEMPVRIFAQFRGWYAEISREVRILSLAHPENYPVAAAIAELALQVERERVQSRGVEVLDAAIAAGAERVDLDYRVVPSAPGTMRRLDELVDLVDDFARQHRLLTMPASPQLVELRRWYAGEFYRQAAGELPTPWSGSYEVGPAVS